MKPMQIFKSTPLNRLNFRDMIFSVNWFQNILIIQVNYIIRRELFGNEWRHNISHFNSIFIANYYLKNHISRLALVLDMYFILLILLYL